MTLEESDGKTVIREQFCRVPLFVQRALYLEESLPSMAYLYVMSPSEGILQGDRYRIDITLRNNARAHITTQSATRIYGMEHNYATQIVNISVEDGCYLEYVPDQIIPYSHSRFYQKVNLRVHDNSTAVYSEVLVPGRVAHGESFEYDVCYLKTLARNQHDVLRFVDIAMLMPKRRNVKTFGMLGDHDVLGNVYVLANTKYVEELNTKINAVTQRIPNILAGATILPHNSGVMARILGNTAADVMDVIYEIVATTRRLVLDVSFSPIKKL